ncbi:MAG: hypothetical protein AABY32_06510 [Nanoarchaeota archaeon]
MECQYNSIKTNDMDKIDFHSALIYLIKKGDIIKNKKDNYYAIVHSIKPENKEIIILPLTSNNIFIFINLLSYEFDEDKAPIHKTLKLEDLDDIELLWPESAQKRLSSANKVTKKEEIDLNKPIPPDIISLEVVWMDTDYNSPLVDKKESVSFISSFFIIDGKLFGEVAEEYSSYRDNFINGVPVCDICRTFGISFSKIASAKVNELALEI